MDQIVAVVATLGGVVLGFALGELSNARTRRREAWDAWAHLDFEARQAIVVLNRVIEDQAPQAGIEPPIRLQALEVSWAELNRVVDARILRGLQGFLAWYRQSVEPQLRALRTDASPTGWEEVDEEGIEVISGGVCLLKDMLNCLYDDRELGRLRHRLWPWNSTARKARDAIEGALAAHQLQEQVGAYRTA